MEIPYGFVLYNQLKINHLALIPFNLGAKGYRASVAHPWAVAVYHQFSFKSMEIAYVSVLKINHLALIPFNLGATFKKRNNTYPPRCQLFLEYVGTHWEQLWEQSENQKTSKNPTRSRKKEHLLSAPTLVSHFTNFINVHGNELSPSATIQDMECSSLLVCVNEWLSELI